MDSSTITLDSMATSKRKRYRDPKLAELLGGVIRHGKQEFDPFLTSHEVVVKLTERGLPKLDAMRLGAFLTADRFRKKRQWVTRTCYVTDPKSGEDKDFTSRPVNTWCVAFCDSEVSQ